MLVASVSLQKLQNLGLNKKENLKTKYFLEFGILVNRMKNTAFR